MGVKRSSQVATSDDDGEESPPAPSLANSQKRNKTPLGEDYEGEMHHKEVDKISEDKRKVSKRKTVQDLEVDEDCEETGEGDNRRKKEVVESEAEPSSGEDKQQEEPHEDAKPVGDAVRVSGKGRSRRRHYDAFEYNGYQFCLEDSVLIVPMETKQKPCVAIIKDISMTSKGRVMITGQWFYRPEETEIRAGANWPSCDTRELFYSFHRDEIPAESVMHRCVVHFIPSNKQIPRRIQHPGFLVQRVYDTEQMDLFELLDNNHEDSKQHELDLLVQKTFSRLGDLPDIESEQEELLIKQKCLLRKKSTTSLDVYVRDERPTRSVDTAHHFKALSDFNALTGEKHRDKWLEKLLEAIQSVSISRGGCEGGDVDESNVFYGDVKFCWPDIAVPAVAAVERAAYEELSSDIHKYNKKMHQLCFNLKNNAQLAQQLLKGELEASQILTILSKELKLSGVGQILL
ncbi:unnamed protein product [Cuscuta epithymum]|uniref:BAH domain-containing protein n=1 Tax=Cuscuta epithymum TaxID=186058 RepID=A0AAV0G900_9ASTE|nr:unnamed protein product [Cuscuta epithymum]